MADWSKPTLASTYANFVTEVSSRDTDLAVAFDPEHALSVVTPPVGTVRWRSAAKKWERWIAGAWSDLTDLYAINISGNAATASNGGVTSVNGLTGAVTIPAPSWTNITGKPAGAAGVNVTGDWQWAGQSGTPNWVWGGMDAGAGAVFRVYNPANMSVGYAASAGSAGYATSAGSCSGNAGGLTSMGNGYRHLGFWSGMADAVLVHRAYTSDSCSGTAAYATSAGAANNASYLQGYIPSQFAAASHAHSEYAGRNAFVGAYRASDTGVLTFITADGAMYPV